MSDTSSFSKFVPGFDFLQGLVNNAGAALPGIGQWVAPTLNPQEIEKRINELRTVQFWLEQNTRMLGATIQALEVQRMTLSTLKTMNVQMDDLRESLKMKTPEASSPMTHLFNPPSGTPTPNTAPPPGVDPLMWWGTLTQQFTQLAAHALKQGASDLKKPPSPTTPTPSTSATTTATTTAKAAAADTPATASSAKSSPSTKTEAKTPAIKPNVKATIKPTAKPRSSN